MKSKFKQTDNSDDSTSLTTGIPKGWDFRGISEIADNFDSKRIPLSGRERAKRQGVYPYYGAASIIDHIDDYIYDGKYLLIAEDGTVSDKNGRPTLQLTNDKFWVSNHSHVLKCEDDNETKYLYYVLSSISVIPFLTGSVQLKLSQANLNRINIPYPPKEERSKITEILSSLDAKIELNRRMNETLESIAQAIFKRWFVDFEFPDKNGKPYKSSGWKMVDSELGEIPQGWQLSNLGESGTFKNGINYLRDEVGDTDFFIANVRDIANNKLLLKGSLDKIRINLSKAKEYLLQEKDILIARSASPGEISLVLGDLEKVIYSGFSIRYRLNNPNNYLYIFHIMQGLKKNLQNYSIGTTLQSVNQETLKNMEFVLPPAKILEEFNKISEQILDKILNNLIQNKDLSQIRDFLLPRLMSGKIMVEVN